MNIAKDILTLIEKYFEEGRGLKKFPAFKGVREFFASEIDKGNLFSKDFLKIYFILKDKEISSDDSIHNIIKKLKKEIIKCRGKRFLYINDNIFLLNILNNNFEDGIVDYCKNLFSFSGHNILISEKYDDLLEVFFKESSCSELKIKIIKEVLQDEYLEELTYYQRIMVFSWVRFVYRNIELSEKEKIEIFWDSFKNTLNFLIKNKLIKELLYYQSVFYLLAINAVENLTGDFKRIEREICAPSRKVYQEWLAQNPLPPCKQKITDTKKQKIAIVRPTISYWSPFKLEYSLAKNLLQDEKFTKKYELYFYSMNIPDFATLNTESKCLELLEKIGIKVRKPAEKFQRQGLFLDRLKFLLEFRAQLIKDDIDILIYSDHLYAVGEFLLLSRAAPKQIYWCHMNHEVLNEGIDKYIIHYPPPPDSTLRDKFEVFRVAQDDIFLRGDEEKYKKQAEEIRKRFPQGTVILGSIGRLIKVDNYEYLSAVAKILQKNPETVYLACGSGHKESIEKKLEELGVDKKRFIFEGWVDPKVYRYVIDVYLNTFPFNSGEALAEFWAKDGEKMRVSINNQFNYSEVDIDKYIKQAMDIISLLKIEKKYPKVSFTKEDFWNFTLLKDNNELFLSYDKIMEDKNIELLIEILKRYENIKIIAEGKDVDKLLIKKEYKDRVIIEDDVYERAYKSDFFALFEDKQNILDCVRDRTTARYFKVEFELEKPLYKLAIENYNKNIKGKNFKETFGKLLEHEPNDAIYLWWELLKDCFTDFEKYKKFIYIDSLGTKLVLDRLFYETNNPKLLAKLKITQRLSRVEPQNKKVLIKNNKLNLKFLEIISKG